MFFGSIFKYLLFKLQIEKDQLQYDLEAERERIRQEEKERMEYERRQWEEEEQRRIQEKEAQLREEEVNIDLFFMLLQNVCTFFVFTCMISRIIIKQETVLCTATL